MPNQCQAAVTDPLAATVETFIRYTTLVESVELSNLDSGGSSIDCDRLNAALADAYAWLKGQRLLLPELCREIIDLNLKRWMVVIARYYLDNIRRRPDVTADYERLLKDIEDLRNVKASTANGDGSEIPGATTFSSISLVTGKSPVYTQSSLETYRRQMWWLWLSKSKHS